MKNLVKSYQKAFNEVLLYKFIWILFVYRL